MKEELEQRFEELAERWQDETVHFSSVAAIAAHPAYQEIIAMGEPAVPLMLKALKRETGHWFYALNAITGANPIEKEHEGYVYQMAEDWIAWGERHGYLEIEK